MCILQAQRIAPKIYFLKNTWYPKYPMILKKKSGMDRVLPKIIGSGIGYRSVTGYLQCDYFWSNNFHIGLQGLLR